MVLPQVFVLLLLKKLVAFKAYHAAEEYGFHRVYRRLLEGMKATNIPRSQQQTIKYHIKSGIRTPSIMYRMVSNHETMSFAMKYSEYIRSQINPQFPPFFMNVASMISKDQPLGRLMNMFVSNPKK